MIIPIIEIENPPSAKKCTSLNKFRIEYNLQKAWIIYVKLPNRSIVIGTPPILHDVHFVIDLGCLDTRQ